MDRRAFEVFGSIVEALGRQIKEAAIAHRQERIPIAPHSEGSCRLPSSDETVIQDRLHRLRSVLDHFYPESSEAIDCSEVWYGNVVLVTRTGGSKGPVQDLMQLVPPACKTFSYREVGIRADMFSGDSPLIREGLLASLPGDTIVCGDYVDHAVGTLTVEGIFPNVWEVPHVKRDFSCPGSIQIQ